MRPEPAEAPACLHMLSLWTLASLYATVIFELK